MLWGRVATDIPIIYTHPCNLALLKFVKSIFVKLCWLPSWFLSPALQRYVNKFIHSPCRLQVGRANLPPHILTLFCQCFGAELPLSPYCL